jgi:glycogen debranching enzyme
MSEDLFFQLSPNEIRDWDFARTQRIILKRPLSEWCSSVYSARLSMETPLGRSLYVVPNRDSPYEGLSCMIQRECWKFLDCFPIGLRLNGKWMNIDSVRVVATPWKCRYEYSFEYENRLCKLNVEYYLLSTLRKCALRVSIHADLPRMESDEGLVIIDPIVDIRHMYATSDPEKCVLQSVRKEVGKFTAELSREDKYLYLVAETPEILSYPMRRTLDWDYKLGNGERHDTPQGIRFVNTGACLLAPIVLGLPVEQHKNSVHFFVCWADKKLSEVELDSILRNHVEDEESELRHIQQVLQSFNLNTENPFIRRALAARIIALTKFGIPVANPRNGSIVLFPEAGSWWFRTVWLRDVYEGLIHNMETLLHIPGYRESIRDIVVLTADMMDYDKGGLPNKLPELAEDYSPEGGHLQSKFYNSADASLLYLILSCLFIKATMDKNLADIILHVARKIVLCYAQGDPNQVGGHSVLSPETGLLLSVPSHSWADARHPVVVNGRSVPSFPLRVPVEWVRSGSLDESILMEVNCPKYYLPEINALWIRTLEEIIGLLRIENLHSLTDAQRWSILDEFETMLTKAKLSYMRIFWNDAKGFMYSILTEDLAKKDDTETSFAVVSAALLENLLSTEEVRRIWNVTKERLLVRREFQLLGPRGLKPFGIIVRNSNQRVYYDDSQYHEAVIWPRDVPYLIKLLERLGETETIMDILINNLDHQMSECAIFYVNELFCLPEGTNPEKGEYSYNPVPLKNPAQWWSHWTDAFLHFFEK